MDEQRLILLLLPGMDGTGELFAEFVKLLPDWIEPRVVRYPRDRKMTYDQLLPVVKEKLPSGEPFAILSESFSTPLAVRLAAEIPKGLRALVLCAGFVSPPWRGVTNRLARILAPLLFVFGIPESVCRRFLVGDSAPKTLVEAVRSTVASVSGAVFTHRLRAVLSYKNAGELRRVSAPLLYIAGADDRLVSRCAFEEIRQEKPDAVLVSIQAPHLILQTKPREAADAVARFLQPFRA
jgi:pimeloyl-[acyl-carrier protein] methyl ester esterase